MLARVSVGEFMQGHNGHPQRIHIEHIHPRSLPEEKVHRILPNLRPMRSSNRTAEQYGNQTHYREPRRVNEPGLVMNPGNHVIRVESRKIDIRKIGPDALSFQPLLPFLLIELH